MAGQGETEDSLPLTPTRSDLYWRRIYDKYDKNNDGKISYIELKAIIESREYEHDLPNNVVDKIMSLADRDNSGQLDFNEFVEMVHKPGLKSVFGHFVARYVDSIAPHRGPVDTTGRWPGFQSVPSSDGASRKAYFTYTDGNYEVEYSCWLPAICMILISVVEIVMFCYDAAQSTTAGVPLAKIFNYNPPNIYEVGRFIMLMFMHVGVVYFLVDLLVQLFLGVPLERARLLFRVMSILQMGVGADVLTKSLSDPLLGASSVLFALTAAYFATIIMDLKGMKFAKIQRRVFLCLAAVDVATAVYDRYWGQGGTYIGYVAHGVGAIAGLLVGIGVFLNLERRKWEKRLWWAAVILYCLLMLGGNLANGSPYLRIYFIVIILYRIITVRINYAWYFFSPNGIAAN